MKPFHIHTARVLLALYTVFCTVTSVEARVCLDASGEGFMESCQSVCCTTPAADMHCEDEGSCAEVEREEHGHCAAPSAPHIQAACTVGPACGMQHTTCSACTDVNLHFSKPADQTLTKTKPNTDKADVLAVTFESTAERVALPRSNPIVQPFAYSLPAADIVSAAVLLN
ncbi:MAG: hypothetical protein CL946_05145 [Ectothiorhodospiraceae bacterium]|nr:hypothetical protein [Ectothiorhodospiraceae bacterium]